MNVAFLRPLESSLEEIINENKNFSLREMLIVSGQELGHRLLNDGIDPDINIVNLNPLLRVCIEELNLESDIPLKWEDVRKACQKIASLNVIRYSQRDDEGKKTFNEDDKIDYLIRNEFFQGHMQEEMVLVVARAFILLKKMSTEWGAIDPNARIEEHFGVSFSQLYIIFFGVISILKDDKSQFPGIDFEFFFQKAGPEIQDKLAEVKRHFASKSSFTVEEIKGKIREDNFKYIDTVALSTCLLPLEEKPFIQLSENKFVLPCPQFLINRLLDFLYFSLNQFEVDERVIQGRTDPFKTDFSRVYGNVLECYAANVLASIGISFDREPPFPGRTNNPGPDIVLPEQSLIIEVSKFVPNKSLRKLANMKELSECYEKVIKKFNQSFNWFKSHSGRYKTIYHSNVIFVVVTAEPFPGMQYSFANGIFQGLLSNCWKGYFSKKVPLCLVVSITEFEILCTVSKRHNIKLRILLDHYLNYKKFEQDYGEKNFKYSLKQFLLVKYPIKAQFLDFHLDAYKELIAESKKSFFETLT